MSDDGNIKTLNIHDPILIKKIYHVNAISNSGKESCQGFCNAIVNCTDGICKCLAKNI